MMKKNLVKIIMMFALSAALSCFVSCEDNEEEQIMTDLMDGYWMEMQPSGDAPLVKFGASGHVFYYVYVESDVAGIYDAYYDVASQLHTRYAVDVCNGRLCLLPDAWYDIVVLNGSSMTLSDGTESVKFTKVPQGNVNVLSDEEYFDRHPRPEGPVIRL